MSIPFSGRFSRSGGFPSAIGKQLRTVNLKAAKKITVKFDPFADNVAHTRNFAHLISSPKIALTNPNCALKTEVVCDRSEPSVEISLIPSVAETAQVKNIILKGGNLTCLELLQLLNKHITALAPAEQAVTPIQTKLEKKGKKK